MVKGPDPSHLIIITSLLWLSILSTLVTDQHVHMIEVVRQSAELLGGRLGGLVRLPWQLQLGERVEFGLLTNQPTRHPTYLQRLGFCFCLNQIHNNVNIRKHPLISAA